MEMYQIDRRWYVRIPGEHDEGETCGPFRRPPRPDRCWTERRRREGDAAGDEVYRYVAFRSGWRHAFTLRTTLRDEKEGDERFVRITKPERQPVYGPVGRWDGRAWAPGGVHPYQEFRRPCAEGRA